LTDFGSLADFGSLEGLGSLVFVSVNVLFFMSLPVLVFRALGLFFEPLCRVAAASSFPPNEPWVGQLTRPQELWAFFPWAVMVKWSQAAYSSTYTNIFTKNVYSQNEIKSCLWNIFILEK
jgi:hypothetical protein